MSNTFCSEFLLRVEGGEVLREAFAQPLFVIVLPPDSLPPPLVRELVREIERRKALEVDGVVAPDNGLVRQHLVQHGEVRRTVSAGQLVLRDRQRECRIRRFADDRRVELKNGVRLLRKRTGSSSLPRIGLDGQREHAMRRALDSRGAGVSAAADARVGVAGLGSVARA